MQPNPYPNESQPNPYPNDPAYPYQDPSYQQAPRNQRQSHTTKYIVAKVIDYITWAILVLEAIFLLRFFLKLLGADPNNQFAQFLYSLTGFFLYPFAGIVQSGRFGTNVVHIFEWSTLIGMLVYGLLYWILKYFLRTAISSPEEPIY